MLAQFDCQQCNALVLLLRRQSCYFAAQGRAQRLSPYKIKKADGFAMKRKLCALFTVALPLVASSISFAAERPTFNRTTRDPRPDILVHPVWNNYVEYRRQYNRPHYVSGWVASKIAPSSQEAMVWAENVQAGKYDSCNEPAMCKRYYAPKPWEVLQTGARPATPVRAQTIVEPTRAPDPLAPVQGPAQPMKLNTPSPSDR